nr:MAG TPA: hypothetical protein [Caudoviricetes sp.]
MIYRKIIIIQVLFRCQLYHLPFHFLLILYHTFL